MNIVETIREETSGEWDKVALVSEDCRVTYRSLFSSIAEMAGKLESRGIHPADRVALLSRDCLDYVVASLAILSLGAAIVPISHTVTGAELEQVLGRINVDAFLCESSFHSKPVSGISTIHGAHGKEFALKCFDKTGEVPSGYHDVNSAFIRFSSGTTGTSKGVVISHESIIERTTAVNRGMRIGPDDVVIWVLSMSYHFVATILLFLRRAATIVLCPGDSPLSVYKGINAWNGTFLYASPLHYEMMLRSREFEPESLRGIRMAISTTARLPEECAREFRKKFDIEIAEAYGIIEVGLPFFNLSADPGKRGSVGTLLPDYQIRIDNKDDSGTGEIFIRGKGMFDAYFSPWRTREQACPDGWFGTGDLGLLDEDGFLFLAGRAKSVINFAGMKVFPDEVEQVLNQHPLVGESRVYGVPDEIFGQLPAADIVPDGNAQGGIDSFELRAFCYKQLETYKVPKTFNFVQSLEKTHSGKIKRR